jgi:hypothetical protein
MAEREVIATRKAPDGDILALCNPIERSWSPRAKDDAIQDIEDRTHSYFVQGTDAQGTPRRVSVYVVDGADPPGKYLRTSPDPIAQNNLRELPACLPMGPAAVPNRVRRNVAKVSQAERNKLRDAILGLNQSKYQDMVSYWFKQDQIHQATHVHDGPAFLPWHRELVNRFEVLLQEVDPTVALHYWDWQTDPRRSPDGRGGTTNLFTEEFMGSPGLPNEEQRVGKPFDEESEFDNGGVNAGSRSDPQLANKAQYPPNRITRQVAAGTPRDFEIQYFQEGSDIERSARHDIGSDWDMIETRGTIAEHFTKMRSSVELEHDWVHTYVGGSIRGPLTFGSASFAHSAFEDPFVFLLHSNVDRLWASWQLRPVGDMRQVSRRLDPEQIYGSEGDDAPITELMEPWAEGPVRPWGPPENQREAKTSKDPSVVRPPLYDQYLVLPFGPWPEVGAAASWAAMLLGLDLPDGDVIEATITYNAVDPATVEFVLESGPRVTWWKAIRVYDADGNSTMIETQEERKQDSTSLPANQVSSVQPLVFHKAKFLGAKRICYRLGDLGILPPGSRATFRWIRDAW